MIERPEWTRIIHTRRGFGIGGMKTRHSNESVTANAVVARHRRHHGSRIFIDSRHSLHADEARTAGRIQRETDSGIASFPCHGQAGWLSDSHRFSKYRMQGVSRNIRPEYCQLRLGDEVLVRSQWHETGDLPEIGGAINVPEFAGPDLPDGRPGRCAGI